MLLCGSGDSYINMCGDMQKVSLISQLDCQKINMTTSFLRRLLKNKN